MRRVLATTAFVLALALALAAPTMAATPSAKKMAAQIRVLQKQVKVLQKQVKKLNTNVGDTQVVAIVSLLYGGCNSAATADAFAASGIVGYAAPPNPVNDYSTCSDLSRVTGSTIARQPGAQTVNVFQTMLNIFKPSGAASTMFARLQH
jgi:hypothetical protein